MMNLVLVPASGSFWQRRSGNDAITIWSLPVLERRFLIACCGSHDSHKQNPNFKSRFMSCVRSLCQDGRPFAATWGTRTGYSFSACLADALVPVLLRLLGGGSHNGWGLCGSPGGGNSVITGQRWNDPPDAPQPLNSIDRNRTVVPENLVVDSFLFRVT